MRKIDWKMLAIRCEWYMRQLFPLRYRATYTETGLANRRMKAVWWMWLGKCFRISETEETEA